MAEIPPLPPGFTLDQQPANIPPLPPGFTLDSQAEQPATEPAEPQMAPGKPSGDLYSAIIEPALTLGTGTLATIGGGLANLGVTAFTGDGARGTQLQEDIQQRFTYEPRTKAGDTVNRALSYPFEKLAEGADFVGQKAADVTGSPLVGAAVNTTLQAAPALLSRRGGKVAGNVDRGVNTPRPSPASGQAPAQTSVGAPAKRSAGLESVSKPAPSLDELKAQAAAAYKRADEAGIVVRENSLKGLKTRIVSMAKKEGLDKDLHPDSSAVLNRVIKSQDELTLSELETLRKVASDAKGALKPADKRIASKIVDEIDTYLDNLSDADVVTGDPTKAKALKEARSLYSRSKKAEEINDLVERAGTRAGQFSGSGFENAIRTEFRQLAMNKKRMSRFTAEEQAAIKKVATGGPVENTFRFIGKFAPTGVVSSVLAGGAGALVAGPLGVALPAAGAAGRSIATRLTNRNVAAAEELMRRGPNARSETPKRNKLAEPLDY